MSTKEKEAGNTGSQAGELEDDILGFLDKEIAASARVGTSSDANTDEVDSLVNSLLQQSLAVSDEQSDSPEAAYRDQRLPSSDSVEASEATPAGLPASAAQDKGQNPQTIIADLPAITVPDANPVFSIAPRKSAWGGRVWIMAGAFGCLLA